MAVSKQPTITPETSSGEGLDEEPSSRGEAKWKRFHPFRVVRKIFRRRIKREGANVVSESSKKSWSTSELQSVQDDNSGKCEVTSPLKIGLSVSHDSIFSPENNTNIVSNETINVSHGSSLSVRHTSMKNMFKDELFTRIRARRDSDDDGIGLQNSPYSSPTTIDVLNQGFKEKLPKSQTTCSAGSLISMGSSENDEDSTGQSSGHSSRMSLIDRRSLDSEAESEVAHPVPLNHNAAHHKIAIRPKRTYGLPRRRMKQVAASKVTSLPSTPEVTEDVTKSIQKLEVTEITSSTTEFTTVSGTEIVSSVTSTEKYEYFQSTIVSSSEISHHVSESQETNEIEYSDISSIKKTDFEELKRNEQNADAKREITCSSSDIQKPTTDNNVEQNDIIENTNRLNTHVFDANQDIVYKSEIGEIGSYINKKTLQEKSEVTCTEEHLENNTEAQISVSSLIKSIEKSDSFKSTDKFKKPLEENKHNIDNSYEHNDACYRKQSARDIVTDKEIMISEESSFPRSPQGIQNVVENISETSSFNASQDLNLISTDCINDLVKRNAVPETLDIESEFVLKPLKKDRKFSGEKDSLYKEIVPEKQKENALVSSIYLEEESIMSNKSLSVGMEESRIFVSHHTSFSDDLKDVLVTEAHNYAAVEEKSEISIRASEDVTANKEREISEPYISSVGITPSMNSGSDITFNSSICDKTMSEDKITISVNSNSDNLKSKLLSPKSEDVTSENLVQKNSSSTVEADINSKVTEKQQKSSNKSHLPEVTSSMVSVKNLNSQKRVSVEIVPFSQRMKERKYQPISFTNKEGSSENKKNTSALVERKLSDRKVTKSKELDKTNNRHSFSGTFTTDSKKR